MNLKKIGILSILVLIIFFDSCEKVINVSIDSVEKKYVVEASLSDNVYYGCRVNLSQTYDITDSNKFIGIEDADITISENNKTLAKLESVGVGVYKANIKGTPGHTYSLSIKVNGEHFTSQSTMPVKIAIDSVYATDRFFLGKTRKVAIASFKDPAGTGNAYRFTQYINGYKDNSIYIFSDELLDGHSIEYEFLIYNEDYTLEKNDDVRIELRCIDNANYKFWYSLNHEATGQSAAASPGNPVSNIEGGAIGYFSAQTIDNKGFVVK